MMAIPHASSGQIIDVRPLQDRIAQTKTHTLVKTDSLEVIRLVLPAGKKIAEHKAPDEITVQCLEGHVRFSSGGTSQSLTAGEMLYLNATEPHAVEAISNSSLLVTLLLNHRTEV